MGQAMAGHVLKRGTDELWVYDLNPEATAPLAEQGAHVAGSLAEIAGAAQVIVVIVVDDIQVLDVVRTLAKTGGGAVVAVSATVRPATMHKAAEICAGSGLRVIDAPVCFGSSGARDGNLAVLCGGDADDVATAAPVFEAYSRAVHHIGPLGAGQLAKTINNMLHWAHCIGNYEALLLAKRHGLDAQKLREVLVQCPSTNGTLVEWDDTRFTWPRKDMDIVLELARKGDLSLPLFGQVDQLIGLLSPDAVSGLLYGDQAPYLGRAISAMDQGGALDPGDGS